MKKTTVVSKRAMGQATADDVYIGRPSKWGNPFRIGPDGTRAQVVQAYAEYLKGQQDLLAALRELRGKRLVCWCKPLACHGDVLAELVNGTMEVD